MTGSLVIRRNPFDHRDRTVLPVGGGETVAELARRHGIDRHAQAVICRMDGRWLLQRDWAATVAGSGSVIELTALPADGGGGGGGKNTTALVLSIAVSVLAIAVGGPLAGLAGFASGSFGFGLASAAITAAISIGGTLLINALIPPQAATAASYGALAAPSPTYSLSARGNQARLGGVIPVGYGRHVIYPVFGATPYSEYADNDQFLHLVLVVGQGEYDIESINIGSTPISSFPEISYEIVGPGDDITLFSPNGYSAPEVTGQELRPPPAESVLEWQGPFTAGPPDADTVSIQYDVIFARGLYTYGDGGAIYDVTVTWVVEAREIDGNGVPVGGYFTLDSQSFTGTSIGPLRLTYGVTLSPGGGRYQVRMVRTSAKSSEVRHASDMSWAGLRSYLNGPIALGDVTVLAVRARATDSLNSRTAQQWNVIATRKLPTWNGASWSAPVATRSIAWALADVLRNDTYGAGMADERIDLDGLLALDAIWTGRGDTFDGIFDSPGTIWETITRIARTGRARPYYQAGMIRFHRDALQTLPVAMFSAANIVADSLAMDFVMPVDGQSADGVKGEYIDDRTWLPATVTSGVGGTPTNPAKEQLFGVVSAAQAARETAYMAAANRYRRAFITFRTELDGLIPSVGDLILVAHDLPRWGTSGNVVAWDSATRTLTLDQDVTLNALEANTIRLRSATGQPSASVSITQGATANKVVLATAPTTLAGGAFAVVTSGRQEPTHYAIGRAAVVPRNALVTQIVPRGATVEVRAVLENASVHVN